MTDENKAVADIHPMAVVHPNAKIGKNVKIGPFVTIDEHVTIGDGTVIKPNVYITGHTTIGKDCVIFAGCSIGEEPQDLKYAGEESYVEIGDRTKIHEYCTIHRGTKDGGLVTKIGDDVLLMAYVHVAHDCIIGNRVIMANDAMLAGHVVVEDRAILGGKVGVHQFVRIGQLAMIGGMSRIVEDVVPFTIVEGSPDAHTRGLNSIGIQRAGIDTEVRKDLKKAYRLLFRSNMKLADAITAIETECDMSSKEVEGLAAFLRKGSRGICRPNKGKKTAAAAED